MDAAKCLLFGASVLLACSVGAGELLPVEDFASLPQLQMVQLSADGKKVAELVNVGGDTALVVDQLDQSPVKPLFKTDNQTFIVNWFHWVGNEHIVVSTRYPSHRGGVETLETRLLSFPVDGQSPINLMTPRRGIDRHNPEFQDQVIDWLPEDDRHLLVQADFDQLNVLGVYRVDVTDGSRELIQNSRVNGVRLLTDRQHRVRVYVATNGTKCQVFFRDADGQEWRSAWIFENLTANSVWPLGFGIDPNTLYVTAYRQGREAIFTVNLRDAALPLVLKYADPYMDTSGALVYSALTGDFIGAAATTGAHAYHFWNPQYQAFADAIDHSLVHSQNELLGFSADETRYLLSASSATEPGTYYFGDRNTGKLTPFGSAYPNLNADNLSVRTPIVYKARDGVEIHGYLTLPKTEQHKNLPSIVFPHGGPIYYESSNFDYWTAFFVSRGYAVLQMDFRGSSGHGIEFEQAGFKQWGLQMQDDISDGTQWLIDQGFADAHRICIVGASYGGYAALMGVAKTPDLYRCAISFAGVTDLVGLVDHARNYSIAKVTERQVGSTRDDKLQLKATSPVLLASQIKVPVLLVHGDHDRSVPFEQGQDMANALKRAGKDYRFVVLKDGDHNLSKYEVRLQLFQEMDKFLSQNLGQAAVSMRQ